MLLRAAAAAALALLVSGDPARLGGAAFGPARLLFPYFWLYLLLEACRPRRRIEDGEVFLAGAAMAALYAGVYAKDLQHGFHPLGVDWLGAVGALFDGGMVSVLALHCVARRRPRPEEPEEPSVAVWAFLAFAAGGAACVYGVKTAFGFYRADRLLGPTWLAADCLFAWIAWRLARRARLRAEDGDHSAREGWIWAAAAFSVWLPAARLVARASAAFGPPAVLLYFFVGVWTVACFGLCRQLWKERSHSAGAPVRASGAAAAAALVRAGGALALLAWLGAGAGDEKAALLFSVLVDLPSRALFGWAFLTSRLEV